MPRKKKIFLVVSLLYILYTLVPIVPDITGLEVWIVNLFTFIALFLLYPRSYLNPVIFWFLLYATVLAFYVMFGKPLTIGIGTVHDSKKVIIEYAFLLPTLSIFSILYYLKDNRLIKIISYGGLLFIFISFVYIIPMILSQSTILRDAVNLDTTFERSIIGIPGYALMHAYIIVIPALLYGLKSLDGKYKYMLIVITAVFIYIILNTYITTSLVITFGVIAFHLLFDMENKTKSFFYVFLLFLFVFILHISGVFVHLFDLLIDFFKGTSVEPKIEGFKYIYLYGDIESSGGHITGRMNLHDMSWKAFFENIFIGGTSAVGGHSMLIDRLGGMGLLAFIPFIMMIVVQIKLSLKTIINKEQRVYYYLGLLSSFTLLYQKGLFGQEGWLFMMVLMPSMIITFEKQSGINIYSKNKIKLFHK